MQSRPTQLILNLGALRHNLAVVRRAIGDRALCAVVKANAYGHGALTVARALEAAGVEAFGVALVEEGCDLRAAGIRAPVLVWAADFGNWAGILSADLTPVLQAPRQVAGLAAAMIGAGTASRTVHLEVDVGMARGGIEPAALADFAAALARHPQVRLAGLMGHLSCAGIPAMAATTAAQAARLKAAAATLRRAGVEVGGLHLANSAGALSPLPPFLPPPLPGVRPSGPGTESVDEPAPALAHAFDMVRVGLALYGLQPAPAAAAAAVPGLRPVMSWTTRLVAIRELAVGEPVSYGCLWQAARPSRIGTLAVGYADGYTRRLTGRAQVLVHGSRLPVVGAICMDFCMVDLTDAPRAALGDEVVLVGRSGGQEIGVDDLAHWSDTISWEVLCGLGPRLARHVVADVDGMGGRAQ